MKLRIPILTTCLIGAGLMAFTIFVSIEHKTLAAQPAADPAYTAHSAHVAAAANQAGGQSVESQLAEILARIEQLEANSQQQPRQSPPSGGMPMGAGNPPYMNQMPVMGPGAKPTQGGMAGMGRGPAVADQMAELRAKMQRLETAMQQQSGSSSGVMPMSGTSGMSSGSKPMPGKMAGMGAMGAAGGMKPSGSMTGMGGGAAPAGGDMGMMDKMMGMMGGMSSGSMPAGAPAAGGGMGMMDMDKREMAGMMGGMGGASGAMPSALPGFPGASHLYHLGATGFFLDHRSHITLSIEQQRMLNQIKEQAVLDKASANRSVQEAEQDLWTLTAADQPDNAQIEAKVGEIGKLKGDARLRFISAIGDAAKILSDGQRKSLTGFAPPAPAAPMAGGMKDM